MPTSICQCSVTVQVLLGSTSTVWHKKKCLHAARAGVDIFRANFFYRFKIMIQNQTTEVLYINHKPSTEWHRAWMIECNHREAKSIRYDTYRVVR